jgi:hypothetical protein
MFISTGKYHYYNKWLIVVCDNELARYYRELVQIYSPSSFLQTPMHGAHITIVAGKYEPNHEEKYWKKYDGQEVKFQYSHEMGYDGTYFWLPVKCEDFAQIRVELGLKPFTPVPWHLTIGNLKQNLKTDLTNG